MSASKTPHNVHEVHVDVPLPGREISLPGTLAQANPNKRSRDLALILHGQMAHRNQIYHKALVRALIEKRELDSYRYDFSHALYNKKGWNWHMAQIQQDVDEIQAVVDYLKRELGYRVRLVVGHSKGALAAFAFFAQTSDPPPYYVNISGRYDMKRARDIMGPNYFPAFQKDGAFEWKAKAAGQQISVKVTPEQFEEFVNYDTSFVKTDFPKSTHVLTIHGTADKVVPVDDGKIYHSILKERSGIGSSTLHLVQDADHNFTGRLDEVVQAIMDWLDVADPIQPLQSPKGRL